MSLLRRIELLIRSRRITATRFGLRVARDPRLVFDLRCGRRPGPRLAKKIEAFLAAAERAEDQR